MYTYTYIRLFRHTSLDEHSRSRSKQHTSMSLPRARYSSPFYFSQFLSHVPFCGNRRPATRVPRPAAHHTCAATRMHFMLIMFFYPRAFSGIERLRCGFHVISHCTYFRGGNVDIRRGFGRSHSSRSPRCGLFRHLSLSDGRTRRKNGLAKMVFFR